MANDRPQDIGQEIVDLEKRYWQALKDNDVDTAVSLSDFPVLLTGHQGVGRIDKDAFTSMMKNAPYSMNDFKMGDDAQVRMLGDDIAIIAYTAHEELTVEGEPVTLDVSDSSTWVRRDGRWRCALHTEAIMGDRFGRDRRPRA